MTERARGPAAAGDMGAGLHAGTRWAGGPSAVLGGWGALALAALLAGWGMAQGIRPVGPGLAGLRAAAREAPGSPGAGGSAASLPRLAPGWGEATARVKGLSAGPLDLNRATAGDLMGLPGIGPALAARIVEHRRAAGSFARVEALRGVPGIGPKRYERLAPHLAVGAPPRAAGETDRP